MLLFGNLPRHSKGESILIRKGKKIPKNSINDDTDNVGLTYKLSGVDINAGDALVNQIKPIAASTHRSGTLGKIGGFGGLFDLKAAGFVDPILISATDGVGTKLKIAQEMGRHDSIGIDLVAMCVNDIIVQGGEPLFFLDYFATGKLNNTEATEVIKGISKACLQADVCLLGGETAEMPGLYEPGVYDLAGFCVGAVERKNILPSNDLNKHDVVFGLLSDGLHSNGFSLVHKILEIKKMKIEQISPFDDSPTIGEALLKPTRIYVKSCLKAIETGKVKALAHITGGGLLDNIPRILSDGLGVDLYSKAWEIPEIFHWLASTGNITKKELMRTFNCGIGMVLITSPDHASDIQQILIENGESVIPIGEVVQRDNNESVVIHD